MSFRKTRKIVVMKNYLNINFTIKTTSYNFSLFGTVIVILRNRGLNNCHSELDERITGCHEYQPSTQTKLPARLNGYSRVWRANLGLPPTLCGPWRTRQQSCRATSIFPMPFPKAIFRRSFASKSPWRFRKSITVSIASRLTRQSDDRSG